MLYLVLEIEKGPIHPPYWSIDPSFLVEKQEWVTNVSSSEESSDEEDIVTIALTNEEPSLPPPPMCLMAKGNSKVCESEDDSDDELDPNEFANLINEYTSVIKREKGKVKVLESTRAKLELAHSDLLGKYKQRHFRSLSKEKVKSKFQELEMSAAQLQYVPPVFDSSHSILFHP